MTAYHTIPNVTGPTLTISVPPEFAGQQVEIEVRVMAKKEPWGEGLKRCAGILADDWTEEDDRILMDTDTCSFHLKQPFGLAHRFMRHSGGLF